MIYKAEIIIVISKNDQKNISQFQKTSNKTANILTSRSSQPFINLRPIKSVPGPPLDLVGKV